MYRRLAYFVAAVFQIPPIFGGNCYLHGYFPSKNRSFLFRIFLGGWKFNLKVRFVTRIRLMECMKKSVCWKFWLENQRQLFILLQYSFMIFQFSFLFSQLYLNVSYSFSPLLCIFFCFIIHSCFYSSLFSFPFYPFAFILALFLLLFS